MQKQFAIASLSLVILLTSTNSVAGQIERQGQCPNVTLVQNFNLTAYLGDWYVYEKYPAVFVNGGTRCLKAQYGDIGNNQISVFLTQLNADDDEFTTDGAGVLVGSGKILVAIHGPLGSAYQYLILDTDYTSYAVVFSCKQSEGTHQAFAWLLTRDSHPSQQVVQQGEAVFEAQGIPTAPLVVQNQDNC